MNRSTNPLIVALALVAGGALCSEPARAQSLAEEAAVARSAALVPQPSPLAAAAHAPWMLDAPERDAPQSATENRSLGGTAILSSLGSAAGLFAGAMAGVAAESWAAVAVAGFGGSFLGAGLAGSITSRNPDGAFAGSLLGVLAGIGVAYTMGASDGTFIAYSLTHGLVTALVAHRPRPDVLDGRP